VKIRPTLRLVTSTLALIAIATAPAVADLSSPVCPQTSSLTTFSGTTLTTDCTSPTGSGCTVKGGVVASGSILQLQNNGSVFKNTSIAISDKISFAAVGDFNKDGWPDFVGTNITLYTDSSPTFLNIYLNQTWQNETCTNSACTTYTTTPNWNNAITPKFIQALNLHTSPNSTNDLGWAPVAAGDFNGDGWDDVFEMYVPDSAGANSGSWGYYTKMNMYLNKGANATSGSGPNACSGSPVGGCPQFANGYNAADSTITPYLNGANLSMPRSTTSIQAVDIDGDGRLDILVGAGDAHGTIHKFLNNCTLAVPHVVNNGLLKCAGNPTFTDGGALVTGLNIQGTATIPDSFYTNTGGSVPVFRYADFDGDGLRDLLVSSPDCGCTTAAYRMRLFKGCSTPSSTCSTSKLEKTASQFLNGVNASTAAEGRATAIITADFSLDGKPDIVLGTDSFQSGYGGDGYLWTNTGTSSPFTLNSAGSAAYADHIITRGTGTGESQDFDVGFVFDYDKDPQHTPDFLMADGNTSGNYYVFADRTSSTYVSCGSVVSGEVDLGAVTGTDSVITSGRITPSFSTNGGTVTFYMSNEPDPSPTWVQASLCSGSTTDYCATFPKPLGQTVRWKATLCSPSPYTTTPTVSSVGIKYTYTEASEHYTAGVIVSDGIAYAAAVREPADRGKLYALNAGLTLSPYWEAGSNLDAMADASRNIYTSVGSAQFTLTTANAGSAALKTAMGTPDAATTTSVVSWIRSARFGLGSTTSPLSHLGAVITSSPAVVSKPGLPGWYVFAPSSERSLVDAFVSSHATRVPLVMFGSKDGMLHALYSITSTVSAENYPANDARNGDEAWAYVPPTVLASMYSDYSTSLAANAAATDGESHDVANYYPDGSPTVFDYNANGTIKTVAMISEGNGGRNFSALDVSSTVNATSGVVTGPTPMWSASPGGTAAGYAFSKPIVTRVEIAGVERFLVIAGTGTDPTDTTFTTKGRVVSAYDLNTGTTLWQFQAKCTVTTDITGFETDDVAEPAPTPTVDGYIDRVVFGDACGYIYKVNPAVDAAGAYIANTGMGTITANTAPNGVTEYALFSTHTTAARLNANRVIAGTISAEVDGSTRMILYFGTGGLSSVSATLQNAFYAIYADTGAVRSTYMGACASGTCEKFYGGVVITSSQVLVTRTIDPAVATNTCDVGSTTVVGYELNASGSGSAFISDFSQSIGGAVQGSLYGDAGALYFADMSGNVSRVGTPRATFAGDDSTGGHLQGTGQSENGASTATSSSAFTLLGWRSVL
jgi:type IV pilus assembly protein PilY1